MQISQLVKAIYAYYYLHRLRKIRGLSFSLPYEENSSLTDLKTGSPPFLSSYKFLEGKNFFLNLVFDLKSIDPLGYMEYLFSCCINFEKKNLLNLKTGNNIGNTANNTGCNFGKLRDTEFHLWIYEWTVYEIDQTPGSLNNYWLRWFLKKIFHHESLLE